MISRGKVAYLKELYPCQWAQKHWMALRDRVLKDLRPIKWSSVLACMPERDPPRILTSVCEGIYPVRQMATKGYYEGCKRIDNDVDLEVFYHTTKAGPHNFTIDRKGKPCDEFQALEQIAIEVPVLR